MKISRLTTRALYAAIGMLSLSSLSLQAQAQEMDMTEIVVKPSLQGREESLEDVSISVTALDGDTMVESGIGKIEELAAYVPNFTMSETPIGSLIFIRGIGSGVNQGFEQSVGIYTDGIYYGRAQLSRAPFLDLKGAEILRGPQVTLFGNNSVAGAVNLTTARPSDEVEFSTTMLYEPDNAGHGERELTTILSVPLTEAFGARFAYKHAASDGYVTNVMTGDDEPRRENHTARLTLGWEFDFWDMALKFEGNKFDTQGRQIETIRSEATGGPGGGYARARFSDPLLFDASASAIPDGVTWQDSLISLLGLSPTNTDYQIDFRRTANGIDRSDNDSYNVTFNTSFDIAGDFTLKTTTGALGYKYDELCDCDFTDGEFVHVRFKEDYSMLSQEVRLISPEADVFDFITGLYWQKDDLDYFEFFDIPAGGDIENLLNFGLLGSNYTRDDFEGAGLNVRNLGVLPAEGAYSQRDFSQKAEVQAAFGQGTFHIADDRLRIILGARFTHTEKNASRYLRLISNETNDLLNASGVVVVAGTFNVMPHLLADKRTEDRFSFSGVLELDVNDDTLLYLSYTQGAKSGGFDVRSNVEPDPQNPSLVDAPGVNDSNDPSNPFSAFVASFYPGGAKNLVVPGSFEFEDEEVRNAEIGMKLTFGDSEVLGSNNVNMNYFYTEFKDLQVSTFDGTLGFNVGNAAAAVSQGFELDGKVQLAPFYILGGALAYLDFRFNEYPLGSCPSGATPDRIDETLDGGVVINQIRYCDYSGQRNVFVPDWSGLISNNFFFPLNPQQTVIFRTTFDVQFTTDYLTSTNLDSRTRQDAYAKLNARMSVGDIIPGEDGSWEVALLGRNLTNEKAVLFSGESPLAFSQTGAISHIGFVDRSRSVALQATYKF